MVSRALRVAVPELEGYSPHTGIGRVVHSLGGHWDDVELVSAKFVAPTWPVLRNLPTRLDVPPSADLVLLPQLMGATALRGPRSVPAIAIVHDMGIVDCQEDREAIGSVARWIIRRNINSLRFADHVVAVSHFTADRLLSVVPDLRGRVSAIHNGVGTDLLESSLDKVSARAVMERHAGIAVRSPALLYVGSERPRKNVSVLIDALVELRHTHPDAQLWKIGAAGGAQWRKNTLERVAASGLQVGHDVVFLEGIDDDLLLHMYRGADVSVTASMYEGFGLPALEAMAAGTPVVVSNRAALPEVVGDAGYVVEPAAATIAAAVRSALISGSVPGLAERASRFSWSHAAVSYRRLFSELLVEPEVVEP